MSDHYPALAAQARQFLSYQTDEVIHAPLVSDVFLIDVVVEMLATPLRFLSYINRRVSVGDRLISSDELTILAYYLSEGLWLDKGMDLVTLADDFSAPLDAAMTVRRTGVAGDRTPEGILTHLEGTTVGRIIAAIENRPDPALVDLGFFLLSLSSEAIDSLNANIARIAEMTRRDSQHHDFTLCFKNEGGVTIHCSYLPKSEAAAKLVDHCQRRKYVQRADSWFGLAIRAEDGMPKFGVNLRSPWKHEAPSSEQPATCESPRCQLR